MSFPSKECVILGLVPGILHTKAWFLPRFFYKLHMKKRFVFIVFIICCIFCSCTKKQGDRDVLQQLDITQIKDNRYSAAFEGVVHDFIIELPQTVEKAPLVLLLPGYNNTAESMRQEIAFEKQACPKGYAVVYVNGSVQKGDLAKGFAWNSGIYPNGNDDVTFLVMLAKYLQKEYKLNKDLVFAAGFSNGGFMAHRLAMQGQTTFKACVSVAGKMPKVIWRDRNKKNRIGFFQITGLKDEVVPKNSDGSARHASDPAIEDVMDYWASSNKFTLVTKEEVGAGSELTKWTRAGKSKKGQVWHLCVKEGYHSWPENDFTGLDTNSLLLDFFSCF